MNENIEILKEQAEDLFADCGQVSKSERVLSVLSGSFMLYHGVKRAFSKPLVGFGGLLLGGGLILRGVTGKCPLKREYNEFENAKEVTVVEKRYKLK